MSVSRIITFLGILILLNVTQACTSTVRRSSTQPELTESVIQTPTLPALRTSFPIEEIVRGTVSIRHSWDETRLPTLASIIKTFQTYYPDVMFDVLYIPADTLPDRFTLEYSEGLAPTLIFGPAEWGPNFFQAGLVADLSNDFDSPMLASLNPAALDAARASQITPGSSSLMGLPYAMQGVLLYRNKEIVTISPNTFDDLVTLAQTSTQGKTIGAYLERSFYYSGAHLYGLGGQLIDSANLPAFNNGQGVAWLTLLKDFELAGPTSFFTDDDLDRFKLGEIGWIIDGSWNMRLSAGAIGPENLAIDPWPIIPGGRMSGFVQAENAYLNAAVEGADRRAAIVFLEFLVSPEAQTLLSDSGSFPVNKNINPADQVFGPLTIQAVEAMADGVAFPLNPDMEVYSQNIDLVLRNYFESLLPPEQALQSAQDSILSDLSK